LNKRFKWIFDFKHNRYKSNEFSEWAIVGTALVVANIESFNNFYYSSVSKNRNTIVNKSYIFVLLDILNYFKIGIIYGLIVDAFKLGS
tara:strand:+ start:256 stop:519 length:264 start_codon:yes stop_codon:yes gene_type:complete